MKKFFALILALTLLLALAVPAIAEDEFVIENGVLTKYNGPGGNVVIPNDVTAIGEAAFKGSTTLTSLTIPEGVTEIRKDAFRFCRKLTKVSFPDSLTSIGEYCFDNCDKLTELVLPEGIKSIERCSFTYCNSLTEVFVPKSVNMIGNGAFSSCATLQSLAVAEDNPNYKSVDNVIFSKSGDLLVCCAATKAGSYSIPDGVAVIGDNAFSNCNKLVSFTFPPSVRSIRHNAFSNCDTLTSLTIPGTIKGVWDSGFFSCDGLRSLVVSSGVNDLGSNTFSNCVSLERVIIQDGLTTLGGELFLNCRELKQIMLPVSVTQIAYQAFENCEKLTDVYFSGSEAQWKSIKIITGNDPLLNATIHYNSAGPSAETTVEENLTDAVRYVPYRFSFKANESVSFALTNGALPAGLSLSADGTISGIPTELGVFSFTVTETHSDGKVQHQCILSCIYQGAVDVEQQNVPGYGFVETAADNGRVDDQTVSSVEDLTDQTAHLEGPYSEFQALYLDAQKLTRNVDYTAEEGSTVITVLEDTLARVGSGTHTLAAEFLKHNGGSSETVYTVQNFTLSGIGGKNVNVTVKGTPIVWWDAEPYIDGNNRTMCPFRIIGEALGLTAGWDGETREAYFTDGSRTIYFPIDGKTARTSEGGAVQMDTAAVIVNGRTYAPVRYLAEYFGYAVGWDGASRTVSLS